MTDSDALTVEELDVVLLPDGRSGTVVALQDKIATVEVSDAEGRTLDLVVVEADDLQMLLLRRHRVVEIVRGLWPLRHDYFGARLTLRSLLRMERKIRRGVRHP